MERWKDITVQAVLWVTVFPAMIIGTLLVLGMMAENLGRN